MAIGKLIKHDINTHFSVCFKKLFFLTKFPFSRDVTPFLFFSLLLSRYFSQFLFYPLVFLQSLSLFNALFRSLSLPLFLHLCFNSSFLYHTFSFKIISSRSIFFFLFQAFYLASRFSLVFSLPRLHFPSICLGFALYLSLFCLFSFFIFPFFFFLYFP